MTLAELAMQFPESPTDDAPQASIGTTSSLATADTAESAHVATMLALLEGSASGTRTLPHSHGASHTKGTIWTPLISMSRFMATSH